MPASIDSSSVSEPRRPSTTTILSDQIGHTRRRCSTKRNQSFITLSPIRSSTVSFLFLFLLLLFGFIVPLLMTTNNHVGIAVAAATSTNADGGPTVPTLNDGSVGHTSGIDPNVDSGGGNNPLAVQADESWWVGGQFESTPPPGNDNPNDENEKDGTSSPTILQIPCGLMFVPTAEGRGVLPLTTAIIDTGLSTSTLHRRVLRRYPQLTSLVRMTTSTTTDSSPVGTTTATATEEEDEVQYYIPTGRLWLRLGSIEATVPSPALWIMDDDDVHEEMDTDDEIDDDNDKVITAAVVDLRLGMDFVQTTKAVIDMEDGVLRIQMGPSQHDGTLSSSSSSSSYVNVPFLRPRESNILFSDKDRNNDNGSPNQKRDDDDEL